MPQRNDWWMCRACRCEILDSSKSIDVFSSEFDFPSIIYKLTKIEIKKDDRLSTMLCIDCVEQLIRIAKFRQLLIESNDFLLRKVPTIVKNEEKPFEAEYIDDEIEKHDCTDANESDADIGENVILLEIEGATIDVRQRFTTDVQADDTMCPICGKVFPSAKSRRVHEYVHKLGQFKCDLCSRILTTAGFLRVHMQNTHNVFIPKSKPSDGHPLPTETANCQCDMCKMYFPRDRISRHVRSHTKKSRRPKCSRCPQTFSCLKNLQRHFKKQHGDDLADAQRTNEFHCGVCGDTFHRPIEFYEHSKNHDPDCGETEDGYNLTCDDCSTPHTDFETYARHMNDVHQVKRAQPYKCRICLIRNGSKTGLYMHINCHYNGSAAAAAVVAAVAAASSNSKCSAEKPFPCDHCPLRMRTMARLREHTRVHTGEQPFACPECNKRFKTRMTLGKHMKSRHTAVRDHLCSVCGKDFATKSVLNEHMLLHTGERPFSCEHCDSRMRTMSRLREHTRIHTGERPYICEVCSKSFRSHTNLRHHKISMHSDERNHLCTICGKKFKFNSGLKTHMWTHSGEDRPYNCTQCKAGFVRLNKLKTHHCPATVDCGRSSNTKHDKH